MEPFLNALSLSLFSSWAALTIILEYFYFTTKSRLFKMIHFYIWEYSNYFLNAWWHPNANSVMKRNAYMFINTCFVFCWMNTQVKSKIVNHILSSVESFIFCHHQYTFAENRSTLFFFRWKKRKRKERNVPLSIKKEKAKLKAGILSRVLYLARSSAAAHL